MAVDAVGMGGMATHQVQLSLQRASRRSRSVSCLTVRAAAAAGLCALIGSTSTWVAIGRFGPSRTAALWGSLGAAAAAVLLAVGLGARLAGALRAFTQAARQVAGGDLRVQLPHGPSSEIGKLAAAFNHMVSSVAADRCRLEELTRTLEQRVRQRTQEVEERSRELESFIYAASHDLRAPVLSIQGFANLLMRSHGRRLDVEAKQHLERIRSNAESMDALLRDLLEVSRIGRVQEAVEWVDSGEMVASVLRELEPETARSGVRVQVSGRLPMIAYSPRLLACVFRNLIGNAIKFMGDQPAPLVSIGCDRISEGYRFWVRDNGVGIRPEDQEKIFALFARANGTDAPGSGVGLAVVKRIVEAHRGKVWVESESAAGSVFSFTITTATPADVAPEHLPSH